MGDIWTEHVATGDNMYIEGTGSDGRNLEREQVATEDIYRGNR